MAHLQGRSDQAAGLFREALLAYHRLGDRRGTAETYHNLGFAYRQAGDWREAEDATANAVRHAELVGEPALAGPGSRAKAELSVERNDTGSRRARIGAGRSATPPRQGTSSGAPKCSRVQALNALHQGAWEVALFHAETARARSAGARQRSSGCGVCRDCRAGFQGDWDRRMRREDRRARAEAGFRQLGATSLLERLQHDLRD